MDQLIEQITTKTGISPEQAREATQTVIDFVKSKLPAPLAGQIDGLLNNPGAGDTIQQAESALENLGGMFGKH